MLAARITNELDLPLLPDTATQILAACQDGDCDFRDLADLITRDQSLAVHVLRAANSAAYAPREPIASLQQALSRLGITTVAEIALAVSLKTKVFMVPGYHTRIRELWMHSAATAAYAKEVASLLRRDVESAFLSGLLHDVGMPIVMQLLCDLTQGKGKGTVPAAVMEAAMIEFHCHLGTLLANKWSLGPLVGSVIRQHHDPLKATAFQAETLMTSLADELAYWALDDGKESDNFPADLEQVRVLGISPDDLQGLLGRRGRVLALTEAFL
jgi:putative nucleotidyltransferase with HDIG domain